MCVVIDLDAVCLICLQSSKDMTPILQEDGDDPEMQIAQKISILSELKTNQSNRTLPSKICSKCLQDLKAAWRFRKNCQAAATIFQTIVKFDAKPESITRELTAEEIRVPHGLQIKRVNIGKNKEDVIEKSRIKKESVGGEFIPSNDEKVDSRLYEELESNHYEESQDKDTHEFHISAETNESDDNEFENDDEHSFIEYYITEEGISDEPQTNIDQNTLTKENVELEEQNADTDKEKQSVTNTYYKPPTRGRPRRQTLVQKASVKSTNVVQTKTKGRIVIDSQKRSEEEALPEVREVKSRKRKSHSPETKTPKICEICGNSYRYQHALNAHMRRHYNDKPFPCECCDKAFVSNVELRRHMRVHTGQKPYACQYCERRFSDFGSRIKHERTHTGERPYNCITCGKSFAYPHVLSVHIRTHTGEKRFRCEYCSKGFTKKAYLISHVKQHHSNYQDETSDTTHKSETNLKSTNLEECVYTTELSNEVIDEEYVEESFEGSSGIIITHSLMDPKIEADNETDVQEIEESEEFTITMR